MDNDHYLGDANPGPHPEEPAHDLAILISENQILVSSYFKCFKGIGHNRKGWVHET